MLPYSRPGLVARFIQNGLYSAECVEVEFSEVRRSKRPAEYGGKHPTAAWREPFGFVTRQVRRICCTFV
jgi:hypothetical protein